MENIFLKKTSLKILLQKENFDLLNYEEKEIIKRIVLRNRYFTIIYPMTSCLFYVFLKKIAIERLKYPLYRFFAEFIFIASLTLISKNLYERSIIQELQSTDTLIARNKYLLKNSIFLAKSTELETENPSFPNLDLALYKMENLAQVNLGLLVLLNLLI
jgi:hypothetical protein